jgi:hypothetical protein
VQAVTVPLLQIQMASLVDINIRSVQLLEETQRFNMQEAH